LPGGGNSSSFAAEVPRLGVQSSKCDKYTPQMLNNRKSKEEEEEEEEDGEYRELRC
jgi:hypothetical protein